MSDGSSLIIGTLPAPLKISTHGKRALREFARALATRIGNGSAFTCLLTNDREMQRLNKDFLGHDYPTDVLSFPAVDATNGLGEIAISVERASAQAEEFGHAPIDELRILMLHGFLHLTGMDHERDRGEMESAEEQWRLAFGLPRSLIARAAAPLPTQ